MINLFFIVFFLAVNLLMAYYDAWRIQRNMRIRHAINTLVYCTFIAIFWKWMTIVKILGLLLIRIPVFNTALNYFRDLPFIYLSRSTTSIVDKVMNNFIRKVGYWTYSLAVFILAIILIVL